MNYQARRIGESHLFRIEDNRVFEVYATWTRGCQRTHALADLNPQSETHWASDSRNTGIVVGVALLLFIASLGLVVSRDFQLFEHWYGMAGLLAAFPLAAIVITRMAPFRVYYRVFRHKSGAGSLAIPSFRKVNPEFDEFLKSLVDTIAGSEALPQDGKTV